MIILENIEIDGQNIKIVRDDLYPGIGGGNKCRKADEYEKDIEKKGCNALVTTGGIQSNHCRAIALLAAKKGWHCHLVYHGTRERFERERGNALLVRLSGASVEFVEANQIGKAMDDAMEKFRIEGFSPYYVTGGGHDIPGGVAYVKAMNELKAECEKQNWFPDHIFLASGTGSTQGGIIIGKLLNGWNNTRIHGISVARVKSRGEQVTGEFVNSLSHFYGMDPINQSEVDITDKYLQGGYECFLPEMEKKLKEITLKTGVVFDTTYSGKALYGMLNMIERKNIISDKILFWHTGGLMNIQA